MTSSIQLYIKNDLKRKLKIKAAEEGVSISEVARYYLVSWKIGLSGYVKFENKDKLPHISGVYFVISDDKVKYIGRSANLKNRFRDHHRKTDFAKLTDPIIHWIHIDDEKALVESEKLLIEIADPDINHTPMRRDKTSFRRTISIDEDLWEQVRAKAGYSDLSISAIIRALLRQWVDGEVKI